MSVWASTQPNPIAGVTQGRLRRAVLDDVNKIIAQAVSGFLPGMLGVPRLVVKGFWQNR